MLLAGEVGDGVEHVGAGVEQETAARQAPDPGATSRSSACAQSCQTSASMLRSAPELAAREHPRRGRTCGERLPGNATTSSRPVRSRVAMSASASAAFMTIGFSRRTSRPASRQAVRLLEVEDVRGDDEDGVEADRRRRSRSGANRARSAVAWRPCSRTGRPSLRTQRPTARTRRRPRPGPRRIISRICERAMIPLPMNPMR